MAPIAIRRETSAANWESVQEKVPELCARWQHVSDCFFVV